MIESIDRFQVDAFFDTPVTLPIWQILYRSTELRIQLVCPMTLSRLTTKRRKSVGPNPVDAAARAFKV